MGALMERVSKILNNYERRLADQQRLISQLKDDKFDLQEQVAALKKQLQQQNKNETGSFPTSDISSYREEEQINTGKATVDPYEDTSQLQRTST